MSAPEGLHVLENLAELCVDAGVEDEKCVVSQYRTTANQKAVFQEHMKLNRREKIPIEWVIDIADESNGWFYGTAYDYDDTTQMLHVMVPDKLNPSFDGNVILDHRTVHLIECVDGVSDALFNKIVRDSIVKVKWDVEWFEEDSNGAETAPKAAAGEEAGMGKWVASSARYYIRMANQLLVEDENFGQDSRGFVMLTADLNVRLLQCHRGRGQEDFNRLVSEQITQSSPEALEAIREAGRAIEAFGEIKSSPAGFKGDRDSRRLSGGEDAPSLRKLSDMSRGVRDAVVDLVDAYDKQVASGVKTAAAFRAFALDGDLDCGLQLLADMDDVLDKADKRRKDDGEIDLDQELFEQALSAAKKLEKGLSKAVKAGDSSNSADEVETLRKMQKRMKEELKERDKEIEALRAKLERR